MNNGQQPAFPRPYSHDERPSGGREGDRVETYAAIDGMAKREYFAAMALQGILANGQIKPNKQDIEYAAIEAIKAADELLNHLNK